MQLYLHIGTEKTGSSYLQSLAANNRSLLLESGVNFPDGGRLENQMLRGEISDGNAQTLTNLLNKDKWQEVEFLLAKSFKEGKRLNTNKVLLSNELILLSLYNGDKINKLIELIYKVGFKEVYVLLVIRDPIPHVLSLYKHRAKGGTTSPFEKWVNESYYYGKGLQDFLESQLNVNWKLTCRKYSSQEGALKRIFFRDWLGLNEDIQEPFKRVNPSLSLSELEIIRIVRKHDAILTSKLYKELIALPKGGKADDLNRKNHFEGIAAKYLQRYEQTWELCNSYLPEQERLEMDYHSLATKIDKVHQLSLSERQMAAVIDFFNDQRKLSQQVHTRYLRLRRSIAYLKNKVISKKK